jgi:neutral trehalase
MEKDIAGIRRLLDAAPQSIEYWEEIAGQRAAVMQKHFWDEPGGLFLDWQLSKRKRRPFNLRIGHYRDRLTVCELLGRNRTP